jgi:Rieske Fe-S protein
VKKKCASSVLEPILLLVPEYRLWLDDRRVKKCLKHNLHWIVTDLQSSSRRTASTLAADDFRMLLQLCTDLGCTITYRSLQTIAVATAEKDRWSDTDRPLILMLF